MCAIYRQFLHVKGHVNACQGFWGACWEGGWRVAGGAWDGGGGAGMAPIFSEKTSFFLQNTPFSLEILNV